MTKEDEDRLDVYADLEAYITAIQFYDKKQFFLRNLTLTFLMGTFAIVGFLLSLSPKILPYHPLIIVFFICLGSVFISFSIAIFDLIFVERMLMSAFVGALSLEQTHSWVFPIHFHMLNSVKEHHASLTKKVKFYFIYAIDLLLLMGIAFIYMIGFQHLDFLLVVLFLVLLCVVFYSKLLKALARRSEKFLYRMFSKEFNEIAAWMKR